MTEDPVIETHSISAFVKSMFWTFVSVFIGAFIGMFIMTSFNLGILEVGLTTILVASAAVSLPISLLVTIVYTFASLGMTVLYYIGEKKPVAS